MASIIWRNGIAYASWWVKDGGRRRQKRRSLETRNQGVAQRRLAKVAAELEAQRWGETEKPIVLFEEACQAWVADHFMNLRPASQTRYEWSLVALRQVLDGTPIDAVKGIPRAKLLEFETARRRQGITTGSIRRDFACLSSMLSYCLEREWTETNPIPAYLKRRKRHGLKEGAARTRVLTRDEERRILEHANPPDAAVKAAKDAIVLAIETGLRVEEQFSGRWRHVRWGLAPVFAVEDGKGGFDREVPLSQAAVEVLTRLRAQRPHAKPDDFIFCHRDGKRAGQRFWQLNKALYGACRRAQVHDVEWHDLRRTFGSRALTERGLSMEEVRDLLGHKDVKTTQKHYAFLNLRHLQRRMAATEGRVRQRRTTPMAYPAPRANTSQLKVCIRDSGSPGSGNLFRLRIRGLH